VKFGSALASENRDEEIVAIPGLRGRPPKEITLEEPCQYHTGENGRDH
jgi:cell division protein FtsA